MQTRCTNHCSLCKRHFHSVAAFDAHRIGSYASDDPETRRRCAHPIDRLDTSGEPLFTALTDVGICLMYETPVEPVTVWTLGKPLQHARDLRSSQIMTSGTA